MVQEDGGGELREVSDEESRCHRLRDKQREKLLFLVFMFLVVAANATYLGVLVDKYVSAKDNPGISLTRKQITQFPRSDFLLCFGAQCPLSAWVNVSCQFNSTTRTENRGVPTLRPCEGFSAQSNQALTDLVLPPYVRPILGHCMVWNVSSLLSLSRDEPNINIARLVFQANASWSAQQRQACVSQAVMAALPVEQLTEIVGSSSSGLSDRVAMDLTSTSNLISLTPGEDHYVKLNTEQTELLDGTILSTINMQLDGVAGTPNEHAFFISTPLFLNFDALVSREVRVYDFADLIAAMFAAASISSMIVKYLFPTVVLTGRYFRFFHRKVPREVAHERAQTFYTTGAGSGGNKQRFTMTAVTAEHRINDNNNHVNEEMEMTT
eukprot:TRINITY_DN60263_c0_g1_i1.p1 TRINITY_DN60263_c0_g1~~TRINITY_DN60263_c0_g1_i1.p1  ORF type:complete len:381 (+),score=143.49 TRINITY_DN60263_c0_g1_i1:3-1145(+)